jgi:general secretion pathway protein G
VKQKGYANWVVLGVAALLVGARLLWPTRYICTRVVPESTARTNIATIMESLNEYMINNNGAYPSSLQALVTPDGDGHCYLEGFDGKIPRDPWKHEFHYEPPTPAYPTPHIWSYGADGKRGGTGDDADIDSDHLLGEE